MVPGSDYYIKFSSENLSLEGQEIKSYSSTLAEKVKASIAKSPNWIQRELARQFLEINNSEEYADLLLNASKKFTDEIAFSIAYAPIGNVPSTDVIKDNVQSLYEYDRWIKYADIIDYDDGFGDYYSTIKYKVRENGTDRVFEYPKEIYYWFVVQPRISSENAEYIYKNFWRDYLFNHNDLGYPLLKEKLAPIEYLWDCESYFQQKNRLWRWSIQNHPTAIEAISYWIGKTVPVQAYGDRPNQPNIIAHEHNGWCGELQRLAVAVQRTLLVPSVGAYNIGEDHVWREFYERGWHENDNWWADGGGAVDKSDVYEYGWGKNISAVYAWKGDTSIYDITSRYIHPEDRYTVTFVVKDIFLQPIDGARLTVLVDGIKDITWIKNFLLGKIEKIWTRLPDLIKGKILQIIYSKFKNKYDEIPDTVDGLTTTIWNYTNMDGECTFELGKGHKYLFVIQQGNLRKPWQLAKNNALRILRFPKDTKFRIFFPEFSYRKPLHHNMNIPDGETIFNISFSTMSYQVQMNPLWTDDKGVYNTEGKVDFFVLDYENFNKYREGKRFTCCNYIEDEKANIDFSTNENDWYIVFRNHARCTNIVLDFSIQVGLSNSYDRVQIVTPDTTIFNNAIFNVGDKINISGISTEDIILSIDSEYIELSPSENKWFFVWNTSKNNPGKYVITAKCGNTQDEILITIIDENPPEIKIDKPVNKEIVEEDVILISGTSWDNSGIESVEIKVDKSNYVKANGTENWFINWNISELELGTRIITIRVVDIFGKVSLLESSFVVNESGHIWGPGINSFYNKPDEITNLSNVIIYANVTKSSPFNIDRVVLFCENKTVTKSFVMYRYGDKPIQERHQEDPLINESNNPMFGFELGQFNNGDVITYWIVAYDTANNFKMSEKKSFVVIGL